jgi:hypothetical protein
MTLSRFLRDYVYFGLGGNRYGVHRRYVNLMATMLLGGLWHGAGWTFIAWGGLHGIYLIVNHAWRAVSGSDIDGQGNRRNVGAHLGQLITFIAVVCGWVLFRSPDFPTATSILKAMSGANGVSMPAAIGVHFPVIASFLRTLGVTFTLGGGLEFVRLMSWLAMLLTIIFVMPNTQQIMAKFRPGLGTSEVGVAWLQWRPTLGWAAACALIGGCGVLSLHRVSEFLYYQF